jgi:hypothetical protein
MIVNPGTSRPPTSHLLAPPPSYAESYDQLDSGALPEALGFDELRAKLVAQVLCSSSGESARGRVHRFKRRRGQSRCLLPMLRIAPW